MATTTAIAAAFQHAFTQLDDLECPVYANVVPEGGSYPCVVVQAYGDAFDTTAVGGQRVKTNVDLMVRVAQQGNDIAGVMPLLVSLDEALHQSGPATYTAGDVDSVIRQREVFEPTVSSGKSWLFAGGVYRFFVS